MMLEETPSVEETRSALLRSVSSSSELPSLDEAFSEELRRSKREAKQGETISCCNYL